MDEDAVAGSSEIGLRPPHEDLALAAFEEPLELVPFRSISKQIETVSDDTQLEREQILEAVASLVDRSLLRPNAESGRYDMLRLIRTFASEQPSNRLASP